jgi:uncharacterized protein
MNGSIRLGLRVVPGASSSGVTGRHGGSWKVRVAAPPEDGRANDALVRLLADTLGLHRRNIAIVSGHAARDKVVSLAGISASEVDRRLAAVSAGGA